MLIVWLLAPHDLVLQRDETIFSFFIQYHYTRNWGESQISEKKKFWELGMEPLCGGLKNLVQGTLFPGPES